MKSCLEQETSGFADLDDEELLADEDIARQTDAQLLITGVSRGGIEAVALRIHRTSRRAGSPFMQVRSTTLPVDRGELRAGWAALLEAAAGGSILMIDVEETPRPVQDVLLDVIEELQSAERRPAVRLIAGTTVSLLDRVAIGDFSEHFFYRLNLVHLVGPPAEP